MIRFLSPWILLIFLMTHFGCSTSYEAKPLPFKTPLAYGNAVAVGGATIGAEAFSEEERAKEAFGFDIRGAGMLPVQVVFDNQGEHPLEINGDQTFLIDEQGNLWPLLSSKIAYERATRYASTKKIAKDGAYAGFLGAAAGSLIGAAIGIVTGEDVLETLGKGAAVGAAAGATVGGASALGSDEARRAIIDDLQGKSLQNKAVSPKSLAHGFLFFPGEAKTARQLRLQVVEKDTSLNHILTLQF